MKWIDFTKKIMPIANFWCGINNQLVIRCLPQTGFLFSFNFLKTCLFLTKDTNPFISCPLFLFSLLSGSSHSDGKYVEKFALKVVTEVRSKFLKSNINSIHIAYFRKNPPLVRQYSLADVVGWCNNISYLHSEHLKCLKCILYKSMQLLHQPLV